MFFGVIKIQISQKEFESKKETVVEFYGKLPFKIKTNVVVIKDKINHDTSSYDNNKIKLFMGKGGSDLCFS